MSPRWAELQTPRLPTPTIKAVHKILFNKATYTKYLDSHPRPHHFSCSWQKFLLGFPATRGYLLSRGWPRMVFVEVFAVIQICAHCWIVNPWYGCIVADHTALIDLYYKSSLGSLTTRSPSLTSMQWLEWLHVLSDAVTRKTSSEYLLMYRLEKLSLRLATTLKFKL